MNNLNTNLVLVTGGAGYISSHAALALIEKGYNIVIFDGLENGHKTIHRKLNDRRAGDPAVLVACNKKLLKFRLESKMGKTIVFVRLILGF